MATKASTPRITTTTIAPANRGIGWSKGMASQVSFPNMLIPRPNANPRRSRRDRPRVGLGDRAGTGRQRLVEDLLEQSVGDRAESVRLRYDALLGELDIAFRRKLWSVRTRFAEPVIKVLLRLRLDFKMHVGESVAAYLSRKAAKDARVSGGEIELRPHPIHGVDHAAKLGDEEGGHHAARRQRKTDRRPGRNHQTIDAGDVLVGVNEQPFPVERHDLNVERLFFRYKRLRGIKVMRADPGHPAEQHDGEQRNRPDDQFQLAGIFPIRQIERPLVG